MHVVGPKPGWQKHDDFDCADGVLSGVEPNKPGASLTISSCAGERAELLGPVWDHEGPLFTQV